MRLVSEEQPARKRPARSGSSPAIASPSISSKWLVRWPKRRSSSDRGSARRRACPAERRRPRAAPTSRPPPAPSRITGSSALSPSHQGASMPPAYHEQAAAPMRGPRSWMVTRAPRASQLGGAGKANDTGADHRDVHVPIRAGCSRHAFPCSREGSGQRREQLCLRAEDRSLRRHYPDQVRWVGATRTSQPFGTPTDTHNLVRGLPRGKASRRKAPLQRASPGERAPPTEHSRVKGVLYALSCQHAQRTRRKLSARLVKGLCNRA